MSTWHQHVIWRNLPTHNTVCIWPIMTWWHQGRHCTSRAARLIAMQRIQVQFLWMTFHLFGSGITRMRMSTDHHMHVNWYQKDIKWSIFQTMFDVNWYQRWHQLIHKRLRILMHDWYHQECDVKSPWFDSTTGSVTIHTRFPTKTWYTPGMSQRMPDHCCALASILS